MVNSYAELTTRVYENVFAKWNMELPIEERDYVHLFKLLRSEEAVLYNFESPVETEEKIWQLVRWFVESSPNYASEPPKVFTLGGKEIEVPKNVGALSAGQNIVLRQMMDKGKYINQFIGMAVAIYLQPLVDGTKFKKSRAVELYEQEIASRPASEIYPLGFFLLNRVNKNGLTQARSFRSLRVSHTARLRRTLLTWLGLIDSSGTPIYH